MEHFFAHFITTSPTGQQSRASFYSDTPLHAHLSFLHSFLPSFLPAFLRPSVPPSLPSFHFSFLHSILSFLPSSLPPSFPFVLPPLQGRAIWVGIISIQYRYNIDTMLIYNETPLKQISRDQAPFFCKRRKSIRAISTVPLKFHKSHSK